MSRVQGLVGAGQHGRVAYGGLGRAAELDPVRPARRPSLIVLALAETGPGRGSDTVGHAAGTYRNRVRIEQVR